MASSYCCLLAEVNSLSKRYCWTFILIIVLFLWPLFPNNLCLNSICSYYHPVDLMLSYVSQQNLGSWDLIIYSSLASDQAMSAIQLQHCCQTLPWEYWIPSLTFSLWRQRYYPCSLSWFWLWMGSSWFLFAWLKTSQSSSSFQQLALWLPSY